MQNKRLNLVLFVVLIIGMIIVYYSQGFQLPNFPFGQDMEWGWERETEDGQTDGDLQPGVSQEYGVSAAHPLAVQVGMNILEQGGNAVDAAVAVSYTLGIVEPFGSGIGGGGVMLIHPAEAGEPIFFDYREMAPLSGRFTYRNVGIPGFVKGMEEIHRQWGRLEFKQLMEPAIQLAEEGFKVNDVLYQRLRSAQHRLPVQQIPQFFPKGKPVKPGENLEQKELAETLRLIQKHGSNEFYKGSIAGKITNTVSGINSQDLESYQVISTEPVHGQFDQYQVLAAPPPLAGITLIQSLQMAEMLEIDQYEDLSSTFMHLLGEVTNKTYQDRLQRIADPNFVQVPVSSLTSQDYSKTLLAGISTSHVSSLHQPDLSTFTTELDKIDTTHFVIVDREGMMVSGTNTLSEFFGSGIFINGFFLNNQLDNFSTDTDSPNNIEPGKRPRSFITPAILEQDGKPVIGIGSPGGSRIPAILTQVLVRAFKYKRPIQEAIDAPRFFVDQQKIYLEQTGSRRIKSDLRKLGYTVINYDSPIFYGGVQTLFIDHQNETIVGAGDPRRGGGWDSDFPEEK